MKNIILTLLFILLTNLIFAQEKMTTRTGQITFTSETPIETIYAENNQVASIFLVDKKTFAFNVLLKSFKFEKALMEEHFNEKYVHSDTYPSAKFIGKFDADIDIQKPQVYKNVVINGEMNFHGEMNKVTTKADITVHEDYSVSLSSKFKLNLDAYKIEIPSLVKDKIASDILINVTAKYN